LYGLAGHVLAMLGVAALAVAVSTALSLSGSRVMATLVLVATTAGPMTLIAAPVTGSLVTSNDMNTTWWWHLLVGCAQLSILTTTRRWATRCLSDSEVQSPGPDDAGASPLARLLARGMFAVLTAVAFEVQLDASWDGGYESPSMATLLCWSAIGAGITIVTTRASHWWTAPAYLAATALMLALVFNAYHQDGGWPGVAGWEYAGMQSPIVLSTITTKILLIAPVTGLALREIRRPAHALLDRIATPQRRRRLGGQPQPAR
jgi:hypothetical protein